MSTNFYIVRQERDDRNGSVEHIGKRSAGWVFTFQGQNHKTFIAWINRITAMGAQERIEDEYGRHIPASDFIAGVMETREPRGVPATKPDRGDGQNWIDEGFSFSNYDFS